MSKPSSSLFAGTKGSGGGLDLETGQQKSHAPKTGTQLISPNQIRFSQTSVNGSTRIVESMKKDGWQGAPIDVVRMDDGELTTLDNTRVVAARIAGIEVKANVHEYDDRFPTRLQREGLQHRRAGFPRHGARQSRTESGSSRRDSGTTALEGRTI